MTLLKQLLLEFPLLLSNDNVAKKKKKIEQEEAHPANTCRDKDWLIKLCLLVCNSFTLLSISRSDVRYYM